MLIGKEAPDFTLDACMPDNEFKEITLSKYRGQYVILFFYPADFTFVCASEVPGFNKLLKEFESRNCAILSCSTDTKHSHKGWKLLDKAQGGIGQVNYPMLADPTKKVAKAYDVLEASGDVCVRGVFLINKEGQVFVEHKNADPIGRNLDEILRVLDSLIFHEKSVAEGRKQVCPANWKLGKKGLTPTLEGVAAFAKENGETSAYVDRK